MRFNRWAGPYGSGNWECDVTRLFACQNEMMSLSRDRALSIAAKVGLGAEELSKPCDDRLFALLANFVHPWRLVFSSLLSEVDLDDVHRENSSEEAEKRLGALRKWKTRNAHKATYGSLVKAILDHGKVDQAEMLCQLLALQPQPSEQGGWVLKLPQHSLGI